MNPNPRRRPFPPHAEPHEIPAESSDVAAPEETFEAVSWTPEPAPARGDSGGRAALGGVLIALAILWTGFTAWSAGRALAGSSLASPALAQWIAIAAGPLALLGLVWLVFGRTRRKEAERFTQSVIEMRSEAQSLESLLTILTQRLDESQAKLSGMADQLMGLGNETSDRIGTATRSLDESAERLQRHGDAFDRAAESARNDIAVLLDDLPKAEASTSALAEQLRAIGSETASRTSDLRTHLAELATTTATTDEAVSAAAQRLLTHLTHIESAGAAAAARVTDAESSFSQALDSLLERTSATLEQIRQGVDAQSQAVSALVEQSSAGLGKAGSEAAEMLRRNIETGTASVGELSARIAEQERASQRMIAEIDRGLALINERFTELSAQGDERANHFLGSLARARSELDTLAEQASAQDGAIGGLADRTAQLREGIDRLAAEIQGGLNSLLADAESGTERIHQAAGTAKPEIAWMRDAVTEAATQIEASNAGLADQQDRFAALLASLHDGVGDAEGRLSSLTQAITGAQEEAAKLTTETGPALVDALLQVREAAGHAADRAREAIHEIIPASAGELSDATRAALEKVIRESVEDRLRNVETVAANAVESARTASDRLTQQMLNLGQSAIALEQHMEQSSQAQREQDSEAFARRVSLLMDSMHSAAIDVGKILSDEVDDKAWNSYLKGNRGIFTSRAVRLLEGSETKPIRAYYEADGEFQQSVNRYIHDFEAMLRRVLAERDGGPIAVTLMSSDMGKLYAALSQAIERRR